ncbi:hypothetical protein HYT53_06280 [Candidatus Woesearchaeota archaeon]|nr:hypothetical protein [Candidatus Woesearchaeota archaeon]
MIQDMIGYIAGVFILFSIVPQIIKSYKTKSVKDISILMLISILIGTAFWIAYGIMVQGMPVIVLNIIYFFVVAYQLFLKIKYEK